MIVIRICFYHGKRFDRRFWDGVEYLKDVDCTWIFTEKDTTRLLGLETERFHQAVPESCIADPHQLELKKEHEYRTLDGHNIPTMASDLSGEIEKYAAETGGELQILVDITDASPAEAFEVCKLSAIHDIQVYQRKESNEQLESFPRFVRIDDKCESVLRYGLWRKNGFCSKDLVNGGIVNSTSSSDRACSFLSDTNLIVKAEVNPRRHRGIAERYYRVDDSKAHYMLRLNERSIMDIHKR